MDPRIFQTAAGLRAMPVDLMADQPGKREELTHFSLFIRLAPVAELGFGLESERGTEYWLRRTAG